MKEISIFDAIGPNMIGRQARTRQTHCVLRCWQANLCETALQNFARLASGGIPAVCNPPHKTAL